MVIKKSQSVKTRCLKIRILMWSWFAFETYILVSVFSYSSLLYFSTISIINRNRKWLLNRYTEKAQEKHLARLISILVHHVDTYAFWKKSLFWTLCPPPLWLKSKACISFCKGVSLSLAKKRRMPLTVEKAQLDLQNKPC